MTPEPTGQITTTTLTDGTRAFQLRFRTQGRRERVTLHERQLDLRRLLPYAAERRVVLIPGVERTNWIARCASVRRPG